MQSQLAAIVQQFEEAQSRWHRLVAATPDERWAKRADPARWSVAECMAHLNLTARAYLPLLESALAEARALQHPAPARYRSDLTGAIIAAMTGPLPGVGRMRFGRVRTAPAFVPSGELTKAAVAGEFDRLQDAQIALTRAADGLPLQAVKLASPFDSRVRYNVWACLTMLPRHQMRHLQQAEQVWLARGSR